MLAYVQQLERKGAREMKLVYRSRKERAEYAFKKYGNFLEGSVLDVGCGEAYLKKYVTGEYVGVDMAGSHDIFVDLEKGKMPFKDGSFDCVVCTDVLEHMNDIHAVFVELTRVTKKYVILSLPNNWAPFMGRILMGYGNSPKFYGLPLNQPKDRHKWFFNCEEAKAFVYGMAKRTNTRVIRCEVHCPRRNEKTLKNLSKWIFTYLTGGKYNNLFALALWTVLEKRHEVHYGLHTT
jgi:ubiquinone/menaquinone biosynthesis C-methylase UbiE